MYLVTEIGDKQLFRNKGDNSSFYVITKHAYLKCVSGMELRDFVLYDLNRGISKVVDCSEFKRLIDKNEILGVGYNDDLMTITILSPEAYELSTMLTYKEVRHNEFWISNRLNITDIKDGFYIVQDYTNIDLIYRYSSIVYLMLDAYKLNLYDDVIVFSDNNIIVRGAIMQWVYTTPDIDKLKLFLTKHAIMG